MPDQWKGSIRTLGGKAVAVIDVTITRTILVDAAVFEQIQGQLREAGLKEAADFVERAQKLPPDMRRFFVVPWSDADLQRINLSAFGDIVRRFDNRSYWRVEGDAATGFQGIFNLSGIERRVDLSASAIPGFKASLAETKTEAKADLDAGKISNQQWEAIDTICELAGQSSVACEAMYKAHADMLREKERQERERKERELRDRERMQRDKTGYHGDFPGGWEGKFGNVA